MRIPLSTRVAVVALALASACSDSPVQPRGTTDLNAALSEMSLSSTLPVAGSTAGLPATGVPANCPWSSTEQGFVCAPVSAGSITVNFRYALLDAAGAPQAAFDPATTASIRSDRRIAGTMTSSGMTMTLDGHDVMTLSGLLTGTHVLDGTQVLNITGTMNGTTHTSVINSTVTGLVLPERAGPGSYPRAGTITTRFSEPGNAGGDFTISMTFNGTSKVDVTQTYGGTTSHCVLDLAATGPSSSTCWNL